MLSISLYQAALRLAAAFHAARAASGQTFHSGKATTCLDIAQKLRRFGAFASNRQQSYADKLIIWVAPFPAIELDGTPSDSWTGEQQLQWYAQRVEGYSAYMEIQSARAAHLNPTIPTLETSAQPIATSTPPQPLAVVLGPTASTVAQAAMLRIQAMFAAARSAGLRRPRIAINIDGMWLRLYPGERNPRATNVRLLDGRSSTYVGFISDGGTFVPRGACPVGVADRISAFGQAPADVARAHGLATGACCFCSRELTDQRSVAMGYGPICAEHFGLEWGNRRASPVEVPESIQTRQVEQPDGSMRTEVVQRVSSQHRSPRSMPGLTPSALEAIRRAIHPDVEEGNAHSRLEVEQELRAAMSGVSAEERLAAAALLDDEDRMFM